MYRRFVFLFWGLFPAVFMLGCVTGGGGMLDNYKPKSTAESEIKKTLMDYEEAFNSEDLSGCLSYFHEDAQVQTSNSGRMRQKKEFSERLKFLWGYSTHIKFKSPDIAINGDEAAVKVRRDWTTYELSGHSEEEYSMVRVGDRWLIKEYKFSSLF